MPIVGSQVTVTTTATLLAAGTDGTLADPVPATVRNQDASVSAYLGGSDVTTAGYELKAGATVTASLVGGDDLYAITSSGTVRVDVLKGRQ